MQYLLDTNILLHYVRNSKVWDFIEHHYFPKGITRHAVICGVSIGELYSLAITNRWQQAKRKQAKVLINTLEVLPVEPDIVRRRYAQIDAFSKNRHKSLRLPKPFSARNMGKNDLWIAATASVEGLPLLSTDRDFEHLDGVFLDFIYVDANEILNKS